MPSEASYREADRILREQRQHLEQLAERSLNELEFHRELDQQIEQQVANDLEFAELRVIQWENERVAALAGIADLSPAELNQRIDRFTEANRQLDYWAELAAIAD